MTDKQNYFTYTDNTSDDNDKTMENLHKQIIIDGVDVSGCKHYKNRTCIADYCLTDMPFGEAKCELNPNCHYKQLKRKEQECKKLKEYFETAKEASNCNLKALGEMTEWADKLDEENDQLKAENEELKKCYKNNSALLDFEETNTTKLVNKVMKLEKTLTEIKEIINDFAKQDIITFPDFEPKRNYDFIQKQCGEPIIQILQKIRGLEK